MLAISDTCADCEGVGQVKGGYTRVPMLADLTSYDVTAIHPSTVLDLTEDHELAPCYHCHGVKGPDGRSYASYRYHGDYYPTAYKSAGSLKAALNRAKSKARVCHHCRGIGVEARLPVLRDCYACSGRGKTLAFSADVDPIVPAEMSLTDSTSAAFMAGWLDTVQAVVVRLNRGGTWNEAHLGLGTLAGSLTDYGRSWEASDEELWAEELPRLRAGRIQLCNMADKDTRRVGNLLVMVVTQSGRFCKVGDIAQSLPMLPPTYTTAQLNRLV